MKKITALITVDDIDPCLPFWVDGLGLELTVTVPHEDKTGFAMLGNEHVEIMYQSTASVAADLGAISGASGHPDLAGEMSRSRSTLFIEVGDLESVLAVIDAHGVPVIVPRRETFYGMDEVFVEAPCGTLVGFACPVAKED